MEPSPGNSARRSITLATIAVVVACAVGLSLLGLHYFPGITNISTYQSYSTNSTISPPGDGYSITIQANSSNINVRQGSTAGVFIELTVSGWAKLSSKNVFISNVTSGSSLAVLIHTPTVLFAYSATANIYLPASSSASEVTISTQNGNQNVFGPIKATHIALSATNGNLAASGIQAGNFTASAVNGNIDVDGTSIESCTIDTVNGNEKLSISSDILEGTFTLSSVNGNIAMSLGKSSEAFIDISTVNGNIATSNLVISSVNSGAHFLQGTLNNGGADLIIKTTNGNINLTGT